MARHTNRDVNRLTRRQANQIEELCRGLGVRDVYMACMSWTGHPLNCLTADEARMLITQLRSVQKGVETAAHLGLLWLDDVVRNYWEAQS